MKDPPQPWGAEVFWDNGKYVAVIRDDLGTRRNVARYNAQTKRDAILDVREHLGLDNSKYE